jgi:hypothetical protein
MATNHHYIIGSEAKPPLLPLEDFNGQHTILSKYWKLDHIHGRRSTKKAMLMQLISEAADEVPSSTEGDPLAKFDITLDLVRDVLYEEYATIPNSERDTTYAKSLTSVSLVLYKLWAVKPASALLLPSGGNGSEEAQKKSPEHNNTIFRMLQEIMRGLAQWIERYMVDQ